jgi:hypothetical protein
MPDASKAAGVGERGLEKLSEGSIVQLVRIGFARLDSKDASARKLVFYFAHE